MLFDILVRSDLLKMEVYSMYAVNVTAETNMFSEIESALVSLTSLRVSVENNNSQLGGGGLHENYIESCICLRIDILPTLTTFALQQ